MGRGAGAVGAGGGLIGLIVLVVSLLSGGGDGGGLGSVLEQLPATGGAAPTRTGPVQGESAQFVQAVVGDVQEVWTQQFANSKQRYQPTVLVLFEQGTNTGCGSATSAVGPFYCPADRKVYVDLSFFDELRSRFGAPGDFAQAYVIAHEFGHHVQNVLGINAEVQREQQAKPREANALSVKLELQADCLAGVWAHSAARRNLLEPGDLEEGLGAAAAVGDDRLQRQAGARVNAESWTHGSSADRMKWFRRGFDGGDPGSCDTFG